MFKKLLFGFVIGFVCLPLRAQQNETPAEQASVSATQSEASESNKDATDSRVAEALQKTFEKDPNLGPYETKLIYRQMLKNQNEQNDKTKTLKQMADTFKYDESQLQQAAALYEDNQKPINYQMPENKDGSFVSAIDANPAQALNSLAESAPINQAFLPQHLKKKAPEEGAHATATRPQAQQPQAQQAVPTVAANNNRRPVQSVRNISLRPTSGTPAATPKKRLGVKSYAFNPENFY